MKFEDKDYTIGELYTPAMTIETQEEADEYFNALVEHNISRYGTDPIKAINIEKSNLGYFAGYYDNETMERVQKLFSCQHPVFGSVIPTNKQAFEAGNNF
jgi:hypothetical protein